MSKNKLKFSHRIVSLPSHRIKGLVMSGTDDLVFYAAAGGADYPTNRSLYRIVNLPSEQLICSTMTLKHAREVIERLHYMNFDWSHALARGSLEFEKLDGAIEAMRREGLVY